MQAAFGEEGRACRLRFTGWRFPASLAPMFETLEVPVWLAVVVVLFAAVAALDRALVPAARWYLRRRFLRAIERVNSRLQLQIKPFKLLERRVMIDRLTYDPQVMEAVLAHAKANDLPQELAIARARAYAREIVPSFSAFAYFGFATRAARFVARLLYRVRTGATEDAAFAALDPDATVIFVMNHRSNLDYVLVTYLVAERSALSYAVGEWARVWPLQQLIRALGGYFIRRRSHDPLYRRVLARYVQLATDGGVTQGIFPEGGLSRDGRLGAPRLGILSYILADFDPEGGRDVVFVPVGLNYDRVLEDRVLLAAGPSRKHQFQFSLGTFMGFFLKQIWLRITRRGYRFGYASVGFGPPISLRATLAEMGHPRGDLRTAAALGARLMEAIGAVVPVLPVSVVALCLIRNGGRMERGALAASVAAMDARLAALGAHVHIPRDDAEYAIEAGLRMLVLRRLVTVEDGMVAIRPGAEDVVAYYANSIVHMIAAPSADPPEEAVLEDAAT